MNTNDLLKGSCRQRLAERRREKASSRGSLQLRRSRVACKRVWPQCVPHDPISLYLVLRHGRPPLHTCVGGVRCAFRELS